MLLTDRFEFFAAFDEQNSTMESFYGTPCTTDCLQMLNTLPKLNLGCQV